MAVGSGAGRTFGTSSSVRHRYVDMWAFAAVHPTNIELLQRLKSGDDRQFGANMDVCGAISEKDPRTGDWLETHIVGIRTDIWNPGREEIEKTLKARRKKRRGRSVAVLPERSKLATDNSSTAAVKDAMRSHLSVADVDKRRLVLKLFRSTGKRIRWSGTIEEITTRAIHHSLGSNRALLSLVVNIPGYDYLTVVQQNHRTFRVPAVFSFSFYDKRRMRMWYLTIKRKWFSVGADYFIESEGRTVARIDGKLISLGYDASITVEEPTLAGNNHFTDLITLFAASVGYHRLMRKTLRRRLRAVRKGESERHLIEDEELWLLKNPRRHAA